MKNTPIETVRESLDAVRTMFVHGQTTNEVADILQATLEMAHAMNDGESIAFVHLYRANHLMINTRYSEAVEATEDGLRYVRGSGLDVEADLLIMQSRQVLSNNVNRALELSAEAYQISAARNGTPLANVMIRYAEAVGASGDISTAITLLCAAEAQSELRQDEHGRLQALYHLCVQLVNAGQYGLVVEYATEAIGLARDLGRRLAQLNGFKFLAMALTELGRLAEAFEVGRKALDLAEQEAPEHVVGDCNGVLGDVYLRLNDLTTALVYFAKALRIYRRTGHRNGQAICLLRMGEIYARAEHMKQAEGLLDQADALARETGQTVLVRTIAVAKAGLYVRVGEQGLAEDVLSHYPDLDLSMLSTGTSDTERVDTAIATFRAIAASSTKPTLPSVDEIEGFVPPEPFAMPAPTATDSKESGIHVTTLGTFEVVRNGTVISLDEWKRKKARDVFKYLVSRHRKSVSVDEIVLHLWGEDTDVDRCLPTLQNAISAIRTALEPGLKPRQPSAFLQFRDGSYILDLGDDGSVDVEQFRKQAQEALVESDPVIRRDRLQGATQTYTGDFLPDDLFEGWTDHDRGSLKDLAAEVFHALAAAYFNEGNAAAAKQALEQALLLEDDGE